MGTNDSTERSGIHAVGLIFTKTMRWIFREQPTSDFGIDAHVETMANGKPTGQLFALQIKSGSSYFREKAGHIVYYGEKRHLDYWVKHSLPVFLILHDPDSDRTLWQRIEPRACATTEAGWSTIIPKTNVLDARAEQAFKPERTPTEEERRREALERELDFIKALMKSAGVMELTIDPSDIGLTDISITCKDDTGKITFLEHVHFGGGGYTAHEAMQELYWFLDYEYAEEVHVDEEYEEHRFDVSVKKDVLGYLAVEKILRDGPPPVIERETPYPEPLFEDEFQEALERDWAEEAARPPRGNKADL